MDKNSSTNNTSSRSKRLGINVLLSALLKVVGISCTYLLVPLTIDYLHSDIYGVWLAITNVLYYFAFFDVGLGNGMRNYLTESISAGNYTRARAYLTSTLFMLTLIALAMALVALPLTCLLDLPALLHITCISAAELRGCMLVAIIFTLILFVVKNIGYIFVALQWYSLYDFIGVAGNALALVAIYVLTQTTEGNLLYAITAFVTIPVAVYFIAAVPIFARYPQLRPRRSAIDLSLTFPIVSKGLGFFAIQITSCVVIFGSSNFIILRLVDAEAVAVYGIAYKLFHAIAMAYLIVLAPMWNAYTDAYVKGDFPWIARTFRRALLTWGLTLVGGVALLAASPFIYKVWLGSRVDIPLSISACVLVYISMYNLNNCVTYLLNGFNKIRVQIITSVVFTLVYLALILIFGRRLGVEGIALSMAACYAAMALIHFYQCRLLIRQKATGIWNK